VCMRLPSEDAGETEGKRSGSAVLDGDVMQALADGNLPEQLADATSALQEQLLAITQEMQKLKSDLYSEQGGLAAKLTELTEQAGMLHGDGAASSPAQIDEHTGLGSSGCGRPGACSSGSMEGSSSHDAAPAIRARPAAKAKPPSDACSGNGRARPTRESGRRVEFAPGTQDPLPMRERYGYGQAPLRQPQQGWTPYVVGFCLLCLGPLRPLVWELVTTILATVPMFWQKAAVEQDLPWYDLDD
jgi:hypothetical protein